MTSSSPSAPRPWGSAAVAAVAIAVALAVVPFAETVATLAGTVSGGDSRYVGQILLVEGPRLVFVPLAVALVAFLSFAAIAPIRGPLRMAQIVRRGFVTAVVALLVAGVVGTIVALASIVIGYGGSGLSVSVQQALALVARVVTGSAIGQFSGQLDVLLAVPLAALLLWGWLRREPAAPEV